MRRTAVIAILVLIAFTAVAGSAYGAFAALTRVTKTIPASVTVQLRVCGDMNGDASVNVFDAILDLQIIVGLVQPSSAQLILGDVVRDGQINVFDAILALQHIVGLTVITSCGPEPPPSGLVSWWTGDGNAQDLVDGNHGTLQGGADFAPGMVDLAFNFDGIDGTANAGTATAFAPGLFTVDFWMNARAVRPDFTHPVSRWGHSTADPNSWLFTYLPDQRLCLAVFNIAHEQGNVCSGTALPLGEWHHLAGSYNGTAIKLYLDGQLSTQRPFSGAIQANTSTTSIGCKFDSLVKSLCRSN